MQNIILRKIRETLDSALVREADVLYLLAEIRKYLDASGEARYPKLRLFCNWVVHSELGGRAAQRIVADVDSYLQKSFKMGCSEADIRAFESIVSLDDFRSQLRAFLLDHDLPGTVCDDQAWGEFLSLYARIVEDCPLTLTGPENNNSVIDQLVVSFVEDPAGGGTTHIESFFPMNWEFLKSGVKRGTLRLRARGELVGSALEWK